YNDNDDSIDPGDLYNDFTFDAAGTWYAIRGDGRLFSTDVQGPPLVDFPGGASASTGQAYTSVLAAQGTTLVMRIDGKVFRGLDTEAIIDLQDTGYLRFAVGTEMPDLTNVKNQPPTVSTATVTAPEGADVELAVIAADRDLPADQLAVDVVP